MKVLFPVALAMGALLLAGASAGAGKEEAKGAAAQPAADADKVICKREATTGSRLPGPRVCRTKAQWDSNDRDSQDAVRKVQESRRSMGPG